MEHSVTSENLALDRQGLHQIVVDRLRKLIVEGRLEAGSRINEKALCEQLQISRTPLREALKVLANEKLVELLPNRGAKVVLLSDREIAEAFEVMARLEAISGELACERITQPELDEIHALHYEMLACYTRKDLPGYYDINMRIHALISKAARNELLQDLYQRVNFRIQSLRFRSNFDETEWAESVQEHTELLEALTKRDGARAAAVLHLHLTKKQRKLKL
ncbi:GntR family transcriptional regulator [Pseudomonas matsuisoli]|uniref:Transcriptional regulator n=1 Tax=Pseudomonas matsuisoli TaxID=1515666 RepID=A0A917UZZ6_9PSED|nr:GntR family transcriptional regulator [Pseudomonas matsuisoli]GGK02635.1 transcriptional regulator [Pseudomonas matsuisoli]